MGRSMEDNDKLETTRALLYGPAKMRKTWWACRAAAFGYNVILFDGDRGGEIMKHIPKEFRARINWVRCSDKFDRPVFADLVTHFLAGYNVRWDITSRRMLSMGEVLAPMHEAFHLFAGKLTMNDVVIMDSWTKMVSSMLFQFCVEKSIAMEDAIKIERDIYGYQDRLGDFMLKQMTTLPCHVILVCHEIVRELTKKGLDEKGKMIDVPIGEQRLQPMSSSKGHGGKLASHFSDVLKFEVQGTNVFINCTTHEGQDGGGRNWFGRGKWDDVQWNKFAPPIEWSEHSPGCVYIAPGEAPAASTQLKINAPEGVQGGGNDALAVAPRLSFGAAKAGGAPVEVPAPADAAPTLQAAQPQTFQLALKPRS